MSNQQDDMAMRNGLTQSQKEIFDSIPKLPAPLFSIEDRIKAQQADQAKDQRIAALEHALGECVKAIESAKAAYWDGHYGKGITVQYAHAVDTECNKAITLADEALKGEHH